MERLQEWEIPGVLARAFESHNAKDIARLKLPEVQAQLRNYNHPNDKYCTWARRAVKGQIPQSR